MKRLKCTIKTERTFKVATGFRITMRGGILVHEYRRIGSAEPLYAAVCGVDTYL